MITHTFTKTAMRVIFVTAALFVSLGASTANATVMLQIERLSDTMGILTGSGSVGSTSPTSNGHLLILENPFDAYSTLSVTNIYDGTSGLLLAAPVIYAYAAGSAPNYFGTGEPTLYFGGSTTIPINTVLGAGSVTLVLNSGYTFGAVGSTGNVNWGIFGTPVSVGSWEIVAHSVPEPGTLALFGLGLAGLGFARRRKVRAAA